MLGWKADPLDLQTQHRIPGSHGFGSAQVPLLQTYPVGHWLSQLPQWLLLDCVSVHTQEAASVPHSCRPASRRKRHTFLGVELTLWAGPSCALGQVQHAGSHLKHPGHTQCRLSALGMPPPVPQVQPSPSAQHWLVGMHCPLHSY